MPEQYIDNTFDVENSTYALVTSFIENSFVFLNLPNLFPRAGANFGCFAIGIILQNTKFIRAF